MPCLLLCRVWAEDAVPMWVTLISWQSTRLTLRTSLWKQTHLTTYVSLCEQDKQWMMASEDGDLILSQGKVKLFKCIHFTPLVPKTTKFYSHAFSVDTSIFQIKLPPSFSLLMFFFLIHDTHIYVLKFYFILLFGWICKHTELGISGVSLLLSLGYSRLLSFSGRCQWPCCCLDQDSGADSDSAVAGGCAARLSALTAY